MTKEAIPPWPQCLNLPPMSDLHSSIVKGVDVTGSHVAACTDLFGAHYRIGVAGLLNKKL